MLAGQNLEEGDQVSQKQQEQVQDKKEIKEVKDIKKTLQNSQLQDSKQIPQTPVQSLLKSDTNFLKRKGGQINLPQAKKRDAHQTPINERLNQSSGRYGLNYSFSKNQDKWELEKLKAKNDFDCQGCGNWLKAKQYSILFLACQHKYHSQCVQNIYQNRLNETYQDYLQKSQSKCPKCAKNQNNQSDLQSQCSIVQNECSQPQTLQQNSLNRSIIKKEYHPQESQTACQQSQKNEEATEFESDGEINFQKQNQQKVIQILEASCESQNSLDSVSANSNENDQVNFVIQGINAESKKQQKKDNLHQNIDCQKIIPLKQNSKAFEEEQAQLRKCKDVSLEYQEIDKEKRQIKENNIREKKDETEDSPQQTKINVQFLFLIKKMSHAHLELGGICYLACDELFEFYNNSKTYCQKGCDFARGRVNDPVLRKEAEAMCKRLTTESLVTMPGELDNIQDFRVSPLMVPYTPQNIYKACLSGIRRQKF